ncbi:MAG: cytochrome b/b6 domain-containing protein [Thermodesulfobacteriota bacterium]
MTTKSKRPALLTGVICMLVLMLGMVTGSDASAPTDQDCIACHGRKDLMASRGKSGFIDPVRFAKSAHYKHGVGCVSCHPGIDSISRTSRHPHRKGIEPRCGECHERVTREYAKSVHAQVSKKICYSCHNPHYSVSFRGMSGDDRKKICLRCHEAAQSHRWLPHRDLHFKYLECTSCHSLNAQIGMLIRVVDSNDGVRDESLPFARLRQATEAEDLIGTLDQDRNGRLSGHELSVFVEKLRERGIPGASLAVRILVLKPTHDFSSRGEKARDCTLCHSPDARFYSKIVLEIPESGGGASTVPVDNDILLRLSRATLGADFYLLGESRIRKEDIDDLVAAVKRVGIKWVDLFGVFLVWWALAAVCFHALLMFVTRSSRRPPQPAEDGEPTPLPTKAWHWLHGLCVMLLVLTGIQLRLPDSVPIWANLLNAVNLHNLAGTVLVLDYIFWLSHLLWRHDFKKRFYISPRGFFTHTPQMLHYYAYLIFMGERFPKGCEGYPVFDPLERVFFLTTMLVFVPVQLLTGVLLMNLQVAMPVIQTLGGLRVVDAVHVIGAYVLISCVIVHTYFHVLKKYRRTTG